MTAVPVEKKHLILPPADFSDDEELLAWMELCRGIAVKASTELDEDSSHIYAKLRRFAQREGLGRFQAARTARSVALPIARAADSADSMAGYFRVAAQRAEAFIEATAEPVRRQASDFTIRGRR
jgi:hypothetical protein